MSHHGSGYEFGVMSLESKHRDYLTTQDSQLITIYAGFGIAFS